VRALSHERVDAGSTFRRNIAVSRIRGLILFVCERVSESDGKDEHHSEGVNNRLCMGLAYLSLLHHAQLRKDRHGLHVYADGPQNTVDEVVGGARVC
jgi:hypothetical protein